MTHTRSHAGNNHLLFAGNITIAFIISFFTFSTARSQSAPDTLFRRQSILNLMEKVADWQVNDYTVNGFKRPRWDWTNGAAFAGIMELAKLSNDTRYKNFLIAVGDSTDWNTGPRRFHADDYCIAQTYAILYIMTKDEKMIAHFRAQADSLYAQPHTESLDWKNNIANREWAWCDALFMGPPALAYLSTATGDKKYLDLTSKLWWKTTDYLYDPAEHLYFRDQSFFDKREKNGRKVFWSRGNGWVMGGLVRVLENMPAKDPGRKKLVKLYKDMASRIAALQQPDGSWHASLLDPASYPIKETSGTGFYTYSLLWGINHHILNRKKYWPVVEKAWTALAGSVHANGMLGFVQAIGAAPGQADTNSTETYGVGAFLLAGSQLYKALQK